MTARARSDDSPTVGGLCREGAARLAAAGVEGAALDARVLLAHALGIGAAQLIASSHEPLGGDARARFEDMLARRAAGEPVARIVGAREFWGRMFSLSPDVLVPRPETETLVDAALVAKPERHAHLRILDLGAGSGALLASLLLERPAAFGIGVDRSEGAARVARENMIALGLAGRAQLVCGHWADSLAGRFDLVVANPPYIASREIGNLPREVREHDPRAALDGGADGLSAYRDIAAALPRLLAPDGAAVLELGEGQEAAVAGLARKAGIEVNGPARRDLSGRPRALVLAAGA